jgi:hypothetical protein
MVELIQPPDPHRLLPPLLACLPTAFASHHPPPALLSLVSPILRQRLQLLTSTSSSSTENWLQLLTWDKEKAARLKDVVEGGTYEPHPSSGEIEVGEIGSIKYKRLDQDTLRALVVLSEWDLIALYLWCGEDEGGSGWKLAELLPYETEIEQNPTWSQSINEANESSRGRIMSEAIRDAEAAEAAEQSQGPEDDDDYWALYDRTPGRTPAQHRSPAPNGADAGRRDGQTEADYYAQYGEVQPAMDNHDPSEENDETRDSSLRGDVLADIMKQRSGERAEARGEDAAERTLSVNVAEAPVNHPQPSPPSPGSSEAVGRLEEIADQQSASEIGIRQHISTTLKSLYRLGRSAGLEREEFDRIVQRELETNSILDDQ